MEKNILKDCFLQGTNLSPVLPEENDDAMFYCNNSMIIKDQNVCMNPFKNQLLQELLKNVSCESGNQTEWGIILCEKKTDDNHEIVQKKNRICWKIDHQKNNSSTQEAIKHEVVFNDI